MRYPVNDYKDKWYIAQGFGEKTDYGFHDGVDINLKTGGDTDLGQPLLAIANGQVTSVHEHTTIPTFGKHIHIKIDTPFGERFVHYAHCQKILVPVNAQVAEGQQVAELGKSGTKVAHCHFAIKKQPTGIDGIAKTQEDLAKWENPIEFIEKCIQEEIEKAKKEEVIPDAEKKGLADGFTEAESDIEGISKALRMPLSENTVPRMVKRISQLMTTEGNYIKFVKYVAQCIDCSKEEETAVREALASLEARILAIKRAKIKDFGFIELLRLYFKRG